MSELYRNIPFSPPDITEAEINEVVDTLKSGWLTTGPKTKKFEKKIAEYIGVNNAVCLNSATAAMEMTLRVLGIGPGDEVITSAYTYTASASVIHHVGAKIILVDIAPNSYEMDYEMLESVITHRTKMIIPVDIAGKMCDYNRIFEIVQRKKELFNPNNEMQNKIGRVIVMADAAHSFGAIKNGFRSGQVADFSAFSFHAVKNLTTAEGGAVVWNSQLKLDDDALYEKYMLYSLHGQSKDALSKSKLGSWEYDIIYPAYKCNMTDIMASIGLIQLKRYEELLEKRYKIIDKYDKAFDKNDMSYLKHSSNNDSSSGHLYLLTLPEYYSEKRDLIIEKMAELGIALNVHYKPLPLLTAYKNLGFNIEDFPNAYNLYKRQISLPLHTKLTDIDVEYVIKTFNKTLEFVKKF